MSGQIKSGSIAGHKEISIEEQERRNAKSMTEGRDVEVLVENRILSSSSVSRAALYDKDDVQQVAGSTKRFDLNDEKVRELLDALLAVHREVEGGQTTVTGAPPKSVDVEGSSYSFAEKTLDTVTLESSGKPDIFLVESGKFFLIVEATEGANRGSVKTTVDSFSEGLQAQGI